MVGREIVARSLYIVAIALRDEQRPCNTLRYPILLKSELDLGYPRGWGTWLMIETKRRRGSVVSDSLRIIANILDLRGFVVFEHSRLSRFWEVVIYFPLENNNSLPIVRAIRAMSVR